ncbi:uncharacterized protein LOC124435400 [Xenia sp. Carnegie-2017]|uniref:uncharacterized protein LOC124435400 n=1 Tax=Xenia sp. Carnegie-2017 TaxID=2897299 RepID=UPI001F0438B0|nr:uncharacterized protein LOC124435400 [Xenia sp. Carnegie-2017]
MGQCLGFCNRWAIKRNQGFDRFSNYAPKQSPSRFGDDHLLNEYQDQQDEIDFSGVGKSIYRPGPSEVVIDVSEKPSRSNPEKQLTATTSANPNYSSVASSASAGSI